MGEFGGYPCKGLKAWRKASDTRNQQVSEMRDNPANRLSLRSKTYRFLTVIREGKAFPCGRTEVSSDPFEREIPPQRLLLRGRVRTGFS